METHGIENDLLDLIEGRLAPDRADAVRAVLTEDPMLLRAVERMSADRRALASLGRATEQAAAADRAGAAALIRESIERAEREALFASQAGAGRRRHMRAIAAAIFLLAGVGLIAGGLAKFLVARNEADLRIYARQGEGTNAHFDLSGEPAAPSRVGEGTVLAPEPDENVAKILEARRDKASLPVWVATLPDPGAADTVRAWTESAERNLGKDAASLGALRRAGEGALDRISAGGDARLSLDEAAGLALTHRLRLVIPPSGPDWNSRRAEFVSAANRGASADVSADAAESALLQGGMRLEVPARGDPELAGIRDALGEFRRRLGGPSPDVAWYEVDSTDPDPNAALPSLTIDDILWWSNAPSAWRPGVSLWVHVVPRAAQ